MSQPKTIHRRSSGSRSTSGRATRGTAAPESPRHPSPTLGRDEASFVVEWQLSP
jgi:hypothetical protein